MQLDRQIAGRQRLEPAQQVLLSGAIDSLDPLANLTEAGAEPSHDDQQHPAADHETDRQDGGGSTDAGPAAKRQYGLERHAREQYPGGEQQLRLD